MIWAIVKYLSILTIQQRIHRLFWDINIIIKQNVKVKHQSLMLPLCEFLISPKKFISWFQQKLMVRFQLYECLCGVMFDLVEDCNLRIHPSWSQDEGYNGSICTVGWLMKHLDDICVLFLLGMFSFFSHAYCRQKLTLTSHRCCTAFFFFWNDELPL